MEEMAPPMATPAVTRITRLYSGGDGHSHFEDIAAKMPLFEHGGLRNLRSAPLPVQALVFRESFLVTGQVLRCSLKRQLIVTLSGMAEIIVHGGDSRVFGSGDTLLAEDLSGSGHRARELLGPRRCLVLPVADDFNLRDWVQGQA
jgi:hypothetical protein